MKDDSVQLGVRVPRNMLAALDAEAGALAERNPGLKFTRSDAVRSILARVLCTAVAQDLLGHVPTGYSVKRDSSVPKPPKPRRAK